MIKYIYYSPLLRCRLKPTGYRNQIELQLQKKGFIFWINIYSWMHVKEGFWGECKRFPIVRDSYQYGNISESYMTGTLDLSKRVQEFIQEYFNYLSIKEQGIAKVREAV